MSGASRRVFDVFTEACERGPSARSAYVEEACGDQAEVRDEVLRLLELHEEEDSGTPLEFAEKLRGAVEGGIREKFDVPSGHPERIDGFRIERPLGTGGMGTVFLAEQDEPRRHVALKILRADVVTPDSLQRFELETQLLARLRHPSIAQIYAAGRFAGPTGPLPYLAMEYVDGSSLRKHAAGLDLAARLELFATICDAVQFAHQNGVIHRDLKPGNILIDADGRPKILDFGVSRFDGGEASSGAHHTATGLVIGTLNYMSPEQALGARDIDTRSDVYALGVLGFELAAGRVPRDLTELPLGEALRTVREHSAPTLDSTDRSLRGDLALIFRKALEIDRSRRYASAAALAEDVRRFLGDEAILARAPTFTYQLSRFVRRNRVLVGAGAVAVLSLVAGLILALAAQSEESRQRRRAERETARVLAQEEITKRATYAAQIQAASLALRAYDVQSVQRKLLATAPESRGWVWRYLQGRIDHDLAFYPMDLAQASQAVFSPDGTRVVVLEQTGALRVFDFDRQTWTEPIDVGSGTSSSVALLDDGCVIVGMGRRLLVTGVNARVLTPVAFEASAPITTIRVARTPGHVGIAAAEEDRGMLHILNPATWKERSRLTLPFHVRELRFDGAASRVLVHDRTQAQVWDLDSQELLTEPTLHAAKPNVTYHVRMALSPDGSLMAYRGLWGLGSAPVLAGTSKWYQSLVWNRSAGLTFAPDGTSLVSAHAAATLRFWDTRTGVCTGISCRGAVSHETLLDLAVTKDGARIHAIGRAGMYVRPATPDPLPRVLRHRAWEQGNPGPYVYGVCFAPDGRRLATTGWDGTVRIWDVATGLPLLVLDIPHRDPEGVPTPVTMVSWGRFSRDGTRLLSYTQDGQHAASRLELLNLLTGRREKRVRKKPFCKAGVQGPGNAWAVGAGAALEILDPLSLAVLRSTVVDGSPILAMAISLDERVIACGTEAAVTVLDVETLAPIRRIDAVATSIAFSPDGRRLATGGSLGTLRVWDLSSGRQTMEAELVRSRTRPGIDPGGANAADGSANVYTVAFTADGRRIACGCRIGAIPIFDAVSGDEIIRLEGHGAYVHELAFSGDGAILASASGDNSARLWDTRRIATRLEEERQVLAAESKMKPHVDALFERLETKAAVAAEIAGDADLDPLHRHAAINLVMKR